MAGGILLQLRNKFLFPFAHILNQTRSWEELYSQLNEAWFDMRVGEGSAVTSLYFFDDQWSTAGAARAVSLFSSHTTYTDWHHIHKIFCVNLKPCM
jgi:hypothetical protein